MYKRKIPIDLNCGLDVVKEVLYGKWKIHLIYFIGQGIQRPGELQRKIPGATRRVLNIQLNELEAHGLVQKKIFAELPPHVEYSLTDSGCSVLPIVTALGNWGDENQAELRARISQAQSFPEWDEALS
ncbi:transcriptional regulator [bacterium]|nr:MAG: transcriptional regulator [bacterium]